MYCKLKTVCFTLKIIFLSATSSKIWKYFAFLFSDLEKKRLFFYIHKCSYEYFPSNDKLTDTITYSGTHI